MVNADDLALRSIVTSASISGGSRVEIMVSTAKTMTATKMPSASFHARD